MRLHPLPGESRATQDWHIPAQDEHSTHKVLMPLGEEGLAPSGGAGRPALLDAAAKMHCACFDHLRSSDNTTPRCRWLSVTVTACPSIVGVRASSMISLLVDKILVFVWPNLPCQVSAHSLVQSIASCRARYVEHETASWVVAKVYSITLLSSPPLFLKLCLTLWFRLSVWENQGPSFSV